LLIIEGARASWFRLWVTMVLIDLSNALIEVTVGKIEFFAQLGDGEEVILSYRKTGLHLWSDFFCMIKGPKA